MEVGGVWGGGRVQMGAFTFTLGFTLLKMKPTPPKYYSKSVL